MEASPRLILAAPRTRDHTSFALVLVLILPLLSPLIAVAASQVRAEDFGIVSELHEVLETRDLVLDSDVIELQADNALAPARNGVRSLGSEDPLTHMDNALDGLGVESSQPIGFDHPEIVDILFGQDAPPGFVDTIWGTLINITDYVIWTEYQALDNGPHHEKYTVVPFSSSLLSLFSQTPLMHEIDIDGDDDPGTVIVENPDVRVGITLGFDTTPGDGWGLIGTTQLWIEPTIEYRVEVINPTDPIWANMESFEASLLKPFAYGINPTQSGESYIWMIDSHFTIAPTDWALQIGFERFWFDLSGAGAELISALTLLFAGLSNPVPGNPSDTGVTIAALSAPISIQIDNGGQTNCPSHYMPFAYHLNASWEHDCRVGVGFGYAHFSPEDGGNRDLWELSYLEVGVHPNSTEYRLPSIVDLTIRTDGVLP